MPLKSYGVLVAQAVDARREGETDTPHDQVHVAADGIDYRISVNVKSQEAPSELLYRVDEDFRHPVTSDLAALAAGWIQLDQGSAGVNLDYVRQTLFDRTLLRSLPADLPGPGNDLADVLDNQVRLAIREPAARVYAFGERWGPERGIPDKVFGFLPGNGVHDIHMNQGNVGDFRKDDGVWQDGALLISLPEQQTLDRCLPRLPEPGRGTPMTSLVTRLVTHPPSRSARNRYESLPRWSTHPDPPPRPRPSRCPTPPPTPSTSPAGAWSTEPCTAARAPRSSSPPAPPWSYH